MWCRAFIATLAFTCTFDSALAHPPNKIKDIVCVLVLSGVQKEDLDVNTLRKLQRHNVNIENMNNEELRKDCLTVAGRLEAKTEKASSRSEPKTEKAPMLSPKISVDQKARLSDSKTQMIILNKFNIDRKGKNVVKAKILSKHNTKTPNIDYIRNLLNLNGTVHHIALDTKTTPGQDLKNVVYINKINEIFMSQKLINTSRPSSPTIDFDLIAQNVMNKLILNQNNGTQKTPFVEQKRHNINKVIKVHYNDSKTYIADDLYLFPFKIFGSLLKETAKSENMQYKDNNVSFLTTLHPTEDSVTIISTTAKNKRFKTRTRNEQINYLSADIIKEISARVKEKVLRDLQDSTSTTTNDDKIIRMNKTNSQIILSSADIVKEISETIKANVLRDLRDFTKTTPRPSKRITKKTTSTIRPTTDIPKEREKYIYQENNKPIAETSNDMNPAIVFTDILEMFQQINASKDNLAPLKDIQNKTQVIVDDIEIQQPLTIDQRLLQSDNVQSMLLMENPEPITVLKEPVRQPVIRTPVRTVESPKDPYSLKSIDTQDPNIKQYITKEPVSDKQEPKITQYNAKVNYHPSAITIQTNSAEVQPLGLPGIHTFVYQNIMVSTNRPLQKIRHDNSNTYYSAQKQNNYEFKPIFFDVPEDNERQPDIENSKSFGPVRHERTGGSPNPSRYGEFKRDYINNPHKERYHETLEKTEPSMRVGYREHLRGTEFRTPKIEPRIQIPLNRAPKKFESHFNRFMKSQQKATDVLERILATRTIIRGEEMKSVEVF